MSLLIIHDLFKVSLLIKQKLILTILVILVEGEGASSLAALIDVSMHDFSGFI
ncbi:hypothetical protein [Mongoliitalea lutea]|uniref:hypothetical protein n=1 Tax=Mongoliitalea lutea TaxID=849756 RepID=UPI00167A0A8C|nr:hypothetical protein [Mongoliitalea lutea]